MKVTMQRIKIDENSTEMDELTLRGVKVGEYSHGLFSKWHNSYLNNKDVFPPSLDLYVCRKLHEKFKTDVITKEDIFKVSKLCKEKFNQTLIEFAIELMEIEIKENNYDN